MKRRVSDIAVMILSFLVLLALSAETALVGVEAVRGEQWQLIRLTAWLQGSGVWGGIAGWQWGRVAGSNHSPPVRRREDRGTASLGAPAVFCIALCAIARHSLLVVGQGCGLHPFAACSAA